MKKHILYYDDVSVETIRLAEKYYGVSASKTGGNQTQSWYIVSGEPTAVKAFMEDYESGDVMPMAGWRELDDFEYAVKVKTELCSLGLSPAIDENEWKYKDEDEEYT